MATSDHWSPPDRTILKYYGYLATKASFETPVWVLFLLSRDISYTGVSVLQATLALVVLIAEVPSGVIADRFGRRNSILICVFLRSIAWIGVAFAWSFTTFFVLFAAYAVGNAFRSGTEDAWLYDVLAERTDEDEFAHVRGRGRSIKLIITAITNVVGGWLATIDLTYPWLATGAAMAVGLVFVWSFPEPDIDGEEDGNDQFTILDARDVIREHVLRPPVGTFVVYSAVFYAALGGAKQFIQPIVSGTGITFLGLGGLYAAFTALTAVASYYTSTVKERVGIRRWFTVVPVAFGLAFALAFTSPYAAVASFVILLPVRSLSSTLGSQYINDHVSSLGRATVLSATSMVYSLAAAPVTLAAGVAADLVSPVVAVSILGVGLVATAAAMLLATEPVTAPAGDPAAD